MSSTIHLYYNIDIFYHYDVLLLYVSIIFFFNFLRLNKILEEENL